MIRSLLARYRAFTETTVGLWVAAVVLLAVTAAGLVLPGLL